MAKKQKGPSHVTCSSSQSQSIPSGNNAKHPPWIPRRTPGMFWIYRSVDAISLAPRRIKCCFDLGTGHYLSPGVWFDPPRLAVKDFMIPPLLSQPPLPKTKQFGRNFCFLAHKRIGWSVTTVLLGRFMNLLFVVNKPDSNSISLNNSKCAGS